MNYVQYIKDHHLLPEGNVEYLQVAAFLQRFQDERYGEGHALFAAVAAFPVFITPELLYKLWLNFQTYRDEAGQKQKINRIAVSDLLLSGLVREVAVDIYEMLPSVRTAMLSCLEQRFRDKRDILRELAEFMLYYVRSYQLEGESITTTVREAQEWNALAYVDPAAAVRRVREALSGAIRAGSPTQQLRINLLLQRLDEQYARTNATTHQMDSFRTLVDYSRGMSEFIRGNFREAMQRFQDLDQRASRAGGAGVSLRKVNMPIPKVIYEGLQSTPTTTETTERGRVFALFVGIDAYPNIPRLSGSTRDANELAYLVSRIIPEERLVTNSMLDAAAHKDYVLKNLQGYLQQATGDDVVLFFFAGHGRNRREGAERNTLLFYEYHFEREEESLTDEDFHQLVKEYATNNPSIVVILDTHAGSDRWLDLNNEKHIVLAACSEDELSYESEGAGVFSKLLAEVLEAHAGKVTYRQLVREVRSEILKKHPQLPQLLAKDSAPLRLFLDNHYSPYPRIQELLRKAGYYDGPIGEESEDATEEALRRFTEEWQLEDQEPLKALEQKILADQRDELRVLVVTGYEPNRINQALSQTLERFSFPVRAVRFRPQDPREAVSQNIQPPDSGLSNDVQQRVDNADFIILLIDNYLIGQEATTAVVRRILQWRQTHFLPVIPLLIQECDWQQHAVAQLPGMELYRMKGRFLEPDWITTTGMEMIREQLEGIGRFKVTENQRAYRALCERFDPAMTASDLQPLKGDLLKAASELPDIKFALHWLEPETSQKFVFGALCALEIHPDGINHFQELESFLSQILDREQLAGLQMSILWQLAQTFDKILEQDEQQSTPKISERQKTSLLGLIHRFIQTERVQTDKAEHGADSLCAFLYGLSGRLTSSLGGNLANFCFEKGLLSEALSLNRLNREVVNLPAPEEVSLSFLETCEQFDGDMSVGNMDQLGRALLSLAQSIPDFGWLVDRLRPNLFQGYIFGAAKAIEAHPKVRYFDPLLGFLDRIAQSENLNYDNLRLRVLYRLLMGMENIIEQDNKKDTPEIGPEPRLQAKAILEQIRDNPRAVEDTQQNKGKGIGERIDRVIGKLESQEGATGEETDKRLLHKALFELDFTPQLEAALKEVDGGAAVIPIIIPVAPAAGPGLLRDRLCTAFNLPPEWLLSLNLADVAAYGWSEATLLRAVLDKLRLNGKRDDLEEFAELLSREYSHSGLVISLENQGSLPPETIADFAFNWLDFADGLARALRDQGHSSGLRKVWLFLLLDELPPSFPPKENYSWWITPVALPPAEPVSDKELDQWTRGLPEDFRKKLYGKFLPSYRPMWSLEVIREVCRELEVEDLYQQYFAGYEPPDWLRGSEQTVK